MINKLSKSAFLSGMKTYLKNILPFVLLVLCIPKIAMHFSNEVNWSLLDFVIAFILLSSLGIGLYAISLNFKSRRKRIFYFLFVLVTFALVWGELAVGIFNTPLAGN